LLDNQRFEDIGHFDDDLIVLGDRSTVGDSTEDANPVGSDIAYILYTSGSTGKPKGVVHTHDSAAAFIDWCESTFNPVNDDRFSSHAPFHFDLSILDLFLPLTCGARVVLIGEEAGKQPLTLAQVIEERALTVWYSTPSTLRLMTGYGRIERRNHSSLRLVLFAGEVFPVAALNSLRQHWTVPRFFNLYGPTETNVCTFFELPASIDAARTTPYPIGAVCDGDSARVLDTEGKDVVAGTEGELCVSGGTVMQGYWNLPERTAHAFVTDDAGVRWYRTGDIVVESPKDGYLFRGRTDRMVKRRGYRVELGEIEAALFAHPDIVDAAVTAPSDAESGVRLDATLVVPGTSRPSIVALKQYCSRNLPAYMIPDRFRFRDAIPQTSTGKVDYQKLQEDAG
jgi:amino acid adenylation domain-containing protein